MVISRDLTPEKRSKLTLLRLTIQECVLNGKKPSKELEKLLTELTEVDFIAEHLMLLDLLGEDFPDGRDYWLDRINHYEGQEILFMNNPPHIEIDKKEGYTEKSYKTHPLIALSLANQALLGYVIRKRREPTY